MAIPKSFKKRLETAEAKAGLVPPSPGEAQQALLRAAMGKFTPAADAATDELAERFGVVLTQDIRRMGWVSFLGQEGQLVWLTFSDADMALL